MVRFSLSLHSKSIGTGITLIGCQTMKILRRAKMVFLKLQPVIAAYSGGVGGRVTCQNAQLMDGFPLTLIVSKTEVQISN
ncbi:hypothetical protein L484_012346 [Morus notabilis]|uniref:Uncharacterized protein n=1 Tax=Morus notabilis TaxID=981085 RepID=W9SFE4_9ROSA|nr:hypothetical protein L484_012346 [Morus notabilis]